MSRCLAYVAAIVGLALVASFEACVGDAPALTDAGDGSNPVDGIAPADAAACDGGDVDCDPNNCGVQGHSCLGGACASGKCQFVHLADNQLQPVDITVDANYVYWANLGSNGTPGTTSDGSIMRVRNDGANVLQLAINQPTPLRLFVFGTDVYWVTYGFGGPGQIARTPVAGGASITLFSNVPGAVLAHDGTSVFWYDGATVRKGSLTAQNNVPAPVTLASGQSGFPSAIAIDTTRVFWSPLTSSAPIKMTLQTGDAAVTTLLTEPGPQELHVNMEAGAMFWPNIASNEIRRMPLSTLDASTIATNTGAPDDVATDSQSVYWWSTAQGALWRMAVDGSGSPTLMATGPTGLAAIAVDATAVYVASRKGSVLKVAK